MPIDDSDLQLRLSVKTGSAGDTTAGTPAGSLGKYISTTQITDATLNNLFDNISGDENAASAVDYRCVFVLNNHATLTWLSPVVWFSSQVAGGASFALAVDSTATSLKGASSAQALEVANETTAPAALSFVTTATSKPTGLALGDIPALSVKAVWIRRTAANTSAVDNDGGVFNYEGDTGA